MKCKRFELTFGLTFASLLLLLFLLSSSLVPAQAFTGDHGTVDPAVGLDYSTHLPVILTNFWDGYFDDFSDPNSGWYSGDNDLKRYGYLDGEYQILLKTPRGVGGITPDLVLPGDYRIEVDIRDASNNGSTHGLLFGTRWVGYEYETYQVVLYPPTQYFLLEKRDVDGTWTLLQGWTYSPMIHQGAATNHLRVDRIGTVIYFYINGTLATTFTDNSFTSPGRDAGLRAYSWDDAPADVRFDNFSATRP